MAKKNTKAPKEDLVPDDGQQTAATGEDPTAPFLAKLMKSNEKKLGVKNVYIGSDTKVIGLEPYGLTLQYIMDLQVIPLQAIITLAGEPKTYKTSGLLEIIKLALLQNGVGLVINTEGKWSASKVTSMLGELSKRLQFSNVTSIEAWQSTATHFLKTLGEIIEKRQEARTKDTTGSEYYDMKIPPMIIGVDSLTGAQSESVQDKLMDEGFGQKTYQDRALVNWQWFNTWGSNLIGLPATVVIVQHLKDKIDNMGMMPQKVTAGGSGGSFMCSMEIRVKNVGKIDKTYYEGEMLEWRMHFNSLGRDKRKMKIPYIETYDDKDNQVAFFDWDESLVTLLLELQQESAYKQRILEATGKIVEYSKTGVGKVYSCEALGIDKTKALEEGIDASALGKMLQAPGSEMRAKLQKALRIQPATVWSDDLF